MSFQMVICNMFMNYHNKPPDSYYRYIYFISDTSVGFTTKLTGNYTIANSIIRGSLILYNRGNAYNGTVFACPSPGLYLFYVSLISSSTPANGLWIYKNSNSLTLAWTGNDPEFNGASASAVVWLDVGDQVSLRLALSSSLSLDHNSAFTGVKVNSA